MNKSLTNARVYSPTEIDAARARAEEKKREIHEEGFAAGRAHAHKIAERHKLLAYSFIGFVFGCLFMGVFAATLSQQSIFTAGALVDRVLLRTETPPIVPQISTRAPDQAYREPCRRGIRNPSTGLCPGEPPTANERGPG